MLLRLDEVSVLTMAVCRRVSLPVVFLLAFLTVPTLSFAQATASTGSIVGLITDPSGAVVSGANIKITNRATGQAIEIATNVSGSFNSVALVPGDYKILISAKSFASAQTTVTVQVGNTTAVNVRLQIGNEEESIEVQDSAWQVNTVQPTVQGVLNEQQIENLPVNGRNFLDLAQLEPGVQIQDGANFGLDKDGFSSISFGGRFRAYHTHRGRRHRRVR
jgi:hypothetical protein